jgi:hypothetical protein
MRRVSCRYHGDRFEHIRLNAQRMLITYYWACHNLVLLLMEAPDSQSITSKLEHEQCKRCRERCKTFSTEEDYVTVCTKKLDAESKIYFHPSAHIKLSNQFYHSLN